MTHIQISDVSKAALMRGNKIEAIKLLRAERNSGLKEAKESVDGVLESDPVLRRQFASNTVTVKVVPLLLFFVVLGLGVYWLVTR